MDITPINGCVLVKLTDSYEFVSTPDKKYDTKTSGIVVAVDPEECIVSENGSMIGNLSLGELVGKKVFFEEYKDGTSFEDDGDKYALIKFEDIRGYKNA